MSAGMNVHVLNVAFCCLLPQGQFRPNQQDVGSGQSRGSAGQDHRGPNQMKRYGFLNRRCPHRCCAGARSIRCWRTTRRSIYWPRRSPTPRPIRSSIVGQQAERIDWDDASHFDEFLEKVRRIQPAAFVPFASMLFLLQRRAVLAQRAHRLAAGPDRPRARRRGAGHAAADESGRSLDAGHRARGAQRHQLDAQGRNPRRIPAAARARGGGAGGARDRPRRARCAGARIRATSSAASGSACPSR